MEAALLAARLVLAAVFVAAAVAKLLNLAGTRAALADFGLPDRLIPVAALGLPLAELAIAVALVPVASAAWAALAAAVLLAAFTAAVVRVLASGEEVECNCFGQLRSRPVGPPTLVRNLALLALAAFIAVAGWDDAGTSATSWIADLTTGEAIAIAISALLAIVVAANAFFSFQLLRQNGRLWAEIEQLRGRSPAAGAGPAPGDRAPAFELPDLANELVSLDRLLERSDGAVLLVFSDPACGACDPLLPEIGRHQRDPDGPVVIFVSRGSADDNQVKAAEHGLGRVLLQQDFEVARAFGVRGMPGAILIDSHGRIAGQPVLGTEAVAELLAAMGGSSDLATFEVRAS